MTVENRLGNDERVQETKHTKFVKPMLGGTKGEFWSGAKDGVRMMENQAGSDDRLDMATQRLIRTVKNQFDGPKKEKLVGRTAQSGAAEKRPACFKWNPNEGSITVERSKEDWRKSD